MVVVVIVVVFVVVVVVVVYDVVVVVVLNVVVVVLATLKVYLRLLVKSNQIYFQSVQKYTADKIIKTCHLVQTNGKQYSFTNFSFMMVFPLKFLVFLLDFCNFKFFIKSSIIYLFIFWIF